ncbi:MAG: YqgE/AlgH family protein [Cryomorphaceae bacterium]
MFRPDNIENEFFVKLGFSFSEEQLAKGKVLISEPFLGDPNFNRSVILLTEYTKEDGAVGLVLNKPTELYMDDIIDGFPEHMFSFHYGGPVNPENLFYLHTLGAAVEEAQEVLPGLFWSGEFDQVVSLVKTGAVGPEQAKFYGGYSGWSAGQLEAELKERSWIICDLSPLEIMENRPDEMWRTSLRTLGKKFSIMAEFPEDPGLN